MQWRNGALNSRFSKCWCCKKSRDVSWSVWCDAISNVCSVLAPRETKEKVFACLKHDGVVKLGHAVVPLMVVFSLFPPFVTVCFLHSIKRRFYSSLCFRSVWFIAQFWASLFWRLVEKCIVLRRSLLCGEIRFSCVEEPCCCQSMGQLSPSKRSSGNVLVGWFRSPCDATFTFNVEFSI